MNDPIMEAEAVVRGQYTAIRLAEYLGAVLAEDDAPPPPGSKLASLQILSTRYDRGELSWAEYLDSARALLYGE